MKLNTLLSGLALAACTAPALTPQAQAVRLTANPEAVRGCEPLGEVTGHDPGWVSAGRAAKSAERRLRTAAATLGGNVVLMISSTRDRNAATDRGEAYRCPSASEQP